MSDHFFQNKKNILIYVLLKYLYNNYRLTKLFLCSVPSNKAFNLETNEEKVKQLKLLEANINTAKYVEDIQLFYKNMHTSCKPKELGLPVW